jgi:cardiolipin hydrolase
MKDRFSKVPLLQEAGIPVFVYHSTSTGLIADIMHNKFALFVNNYESRPLVWTGSFNFTKSAHARNRENVTVTDDARLVKKYQKEFERLKKSIIGSKDEQTKKSTIKTSSRSSKRTKKSPRSSTRVV